MLGWGEGSTSGGARSCTQGSLGACKLALLPGVLQSGGAGVWSAGSLQEGIQDLTPQLTLAWVELHRSIPTCTHCHGRPGDHPHGGNAVVAGGGDGDGCGVEGCGGDAVGLHHRGVMDHMGLSRVDGLGVVSSLETNTHQHPGEKG